MEAVYISPRGACLGPVGKTAFLGLGKGGGGLGGGPRLQKTPHVSHVEGVHQVPWWVFSALPHGWHHGSHG